MGVPCAGNRTRVCASHPLRGRPRHPSHWVTPRPLPPSPSVRPARITWFISVEMGKLISEASTGSSRKRARIGPTESASRPRSGEPIVRENERPVQLTRSGESHRGFGRPRSLARTAAVKHQAEKLQPAVRSDRPPRASGRHWRRRPLAPHPLARHHVRRRRRRQHLPRRFRLESVRESQASTRKMRLAVPPTRSPRLAPPRPSSSPSLVPSNAAQLGQRKVIPGREAVFWVRLLFLIVLWSLLPSPRTLTSPFRTVPELVSSSRPHLSASHYMHVAREIKAGRLALSTPTSDLHPRQLPVTSWPQWTLESVLGHTFLMERGDVWGGGPGIVRKKRGTLREGVRGSSNLEKNYWKGQRMHNMSSVATKTCLLLLFIPLSFCFV